MQKPVADPSSPFNGVVGSLRLEIFWEELGALATIVVGGCSTTAVDSRPTTVGGGGFAVLVEMWLDHVLLP